jgi:general secretion pathway protein D
MTRWRLVAAMSAVGLLTACAPLVTQEASRLAASGRREDALRLLDEARRNDPRDISVRSAWLREREQVIARAVQAAQTERRAGRLDGAVQALERARLLDDKDPRVLAEQTEIDRQRRLDAVLADALALEAQQRYADAEARLRPLLQEAPLHTAARALQLRLRERASLATENALAPTLGPAFQKVVTLEFREAPLRSVLEALARGNGVNLVFDREVRGDARVSIFLRSVTIEDALRMVLATQQLDRKLLNDSTLFVYPNTPAKQREHQDLVTRSFYLANADLKQAQNLARTIAKSRDVFIDERANLLVVRDTADTMRVVERMMATLDVPDPEVVLELEVLEVGSTRVDELGLQWPDTVRYGLIGGGGEVALGDRRDFRGSIANPAVVATLRGSDGASHIIANPRLRARNREKAKVLIGEKLPVFTTTATANVGVSASVTYLDVGLKVEIEPSVQLDNDVVMRVNLEVSSTTARVQGPQGSTAFQIGTRQASTSLRLRDGETQVLAGLIREEDSRGIAGVPGLASLPVVGRLFGLHTDQRLRSEVVLLITPRVVRNLTLPSSDILMAAAGVEANPGAAPLRLKRGAAVGIPTSALGVGGGATALAPGDGATGTATAAPVAAEPVATGAAIVVAASAEVFAGETASVTLANRSPLALKGELEYDTSRLQPAQGGDARGRLPFSLPAGGEQVLVFRTLPVAETTPTAVSVINIAPADAGAPAPLVSIQGSSAITVKKR